LQAEVGVTEFSGVPAYNPFYEALSKRMSSFKLELAEEKTNLLKFSRRDRKHSGALEFLGFEFRWAFNHYRRLVLKRRTARKKYRASLAGFYAWTRANCRMRKEKFFAALNAKLRGYYCGRRRKAALSW